MTQQQDAPVPQQFAAPTLIPADAAPIEVLTADFNEDGSLDLLYVAETGSSTEADGSLTAYILLNDGHGHFAPYTSLSLPRGAITLGDFLGTGHVSIADLVATPGSPIALEIFAGTGAGTFAPPDLTTALLKLPNLPFASLTNPTAARLESYGGVDLIAEDTASHILFTFHADSQTFPQTSGFTVHSGIALSAGTGPIAVADLTGDGIPDLVVLGAGGQIDIYRGTGNGTFSASPTTAASTIPEDAANPSLPTAPRHFDHIAIADMNGDGIPDLIVSDGSQINIRYGNSNGTFSPESQYSTGQPIRTFAIADLNGDGMPDLAIAGSGPANSPGSITILMNALKPRTATTTGTVTASPEPSYYDEAFSLTATITPPSTSTAISPTGTVSFFVNGVSAGTPVTVSAASASIAVAASVYAALAPGTYAISAQYSGDSNYAAATFTANHGIARWPTTTVLTPDPPLVTYYNYALGLNGTFAVSVPPGAPAATGNYTLLDNGVAVAICTNIPLNIECDYGYPVLLNAGVHSFVIEYLGDTYTAPSFSVPVVFTILPDLTSATLAAAPTTVVAGQSIAFNATLTGNLAVPTGPVLFYDGPVANQIQIGTATLNSAGIATLNTSTLASGTHTVTAVYPATQNFNAATSNSVTVTVLPINPAIPTVISLSSSVNPSAPGQPVTFTATVNSTGPFIYDPTGSVTFLDGTAVLGTGALNQYGIATFTTSTLASGSHAITASYPGVTGSGTTLSFAPATSAVLTQIVYYTIPMAPVGFILNVTPTPVTVPDGAIATLQVTVTPTSGFAQPVLLACAGLPREATCTFEQTTIPSGGGTTTLFLTASSPHPCGDPGDPYYSRTGPLTAIPVFAALGLLLLPRRRRLLTRRIATLFALILLTALATLSGCGTCTDLGTSPGKYSFNVTGTAQGGPVTLTVSQTIPLTVSNP